MTDPLRPFTQAIRSLWSSRARSPHSADETSHVSASVASAAQSAGRPRATRAGESLRSRLKSRLDAIDGKDTKQMRDAFVETVLIWELGDALAPDPGLADVVARVSEQLTTDPMVVSRLQELLLEIRSTD